MRWVMINPSHLIYICRSLSNEKETATMKVVVSSFRGEMSFTYSNDVMRKSSKLTSAELTLSPLHMITPDEPLV